MTSQDERKQLLEAIARVAKEKETSVLSREQFSSATGISLNRIYQLFDGWRDACEQAGISANIRNLPLDDATLFEDMRHVFMERGEICTRTKFAKLSKYSVDTLKKRHGAWPNILAAFRGWLVEQNVEFPHLDSLPTGIPTTTVPKGTAAPAPTTRTTYLVPAQPGRGPTYGAFLNFRGLQHAPMNEQGVVFLFGMVCHELGFVVELVRTGFPDCEAKRCIDRRLDAWERVRIEFEFKAANAKVHPMGGCDLIVCWENDWPDCPVEVIELKTAIRRLDSSAGLYASGT
ncbi:MAG: hypothetical protein ACLQVL_22035 [Terriglobia bacterium]